MEIKKEIIARCKEYDPSAQKQVYELLFPYLNSICRRYLSNSPSKNDALQDAFIKIFTKIGQFDVKKGAFRSWAARIAINTCLHQSNWKVSRKETELTAQEYQIPVSPDIIERLSNEEVLKLLSKMPSQYYQVFNLFVVDGFNHKEISKMLDISIDLSRKRLSRARSWISQRTELKTMIS